MVITFLGKNSRDYLVYNAIKKNAQAMPGTILVIKLNEQEILLNLLQWQYLKNYLLKDRELAGEPEIICSILQASRLSCF